MLTARDKTGSMSVRPVHLRTRSYETALIWDLFVLHRV